MYFIISIRYILCLIRMDTKTNIRLDLTCFPLLSVERQSKTIFFSCIFVESCICLLSVLSFVPLYLYFFVVFLSLFLSLTITKPSSPSCVSLFKCITVNSFGGCYWSSCILLPGNLFSPLSECCSNCRGEQR